MHKNFTLLDPFVIVSHHVSNYHVNMIFKHINVLSSFLGAVLYLFRNFLKCSVVIN